MYMPVMTDMAHMGKNIGSALNAGWDLGSGRLNRFGMNLGSVGGAATAFGLAPIGALGGAVIGAQFKGDNIGQNMAIGAGVGAVAGVAALPTIGLAAHGGFAAAKGLVNLGGHAVNALPGMLEGAGTIGMAGLGAVAITGRKLLDNLVFSGKEMVRWDIPTESLGRQETKSLIGRMTHTGGVKLTAFGHAQLWGGAATIGATAAYKEVMQQKMGQMDGQITRMTPKVPYYADNAGATGDLVFALNRNRRG